MATLDLVNVQKSFGPVKILHDISIGLTDGEFLVLVGPSGCGKSTLMNIIAGLEEPSGGTLRLEGRDITRVAPADRNISMVFQSYALYPNMTVAQNIEFPLQMRKVDKAQRVQRVAQVSKLLQIEHLLERKPRQLSGGQRQRVAIGRALAREPKLYLFDEPLSNLDAQLRVDMRTEIKKLHQRLKATIVYVTHDQIEAMTMADQIVVMRDGIVEQRGRPLELYDRPANLFVAGFIGSPAMNFLPGTLRRANNEAMVDLGPGVSVPVPQNVAGSDGQRIIFGTRPEHLVLDTNGSGLKASVVVVEPTGADTQVFAKFGDTEVTAVFRERHDFRSGETIRLMPDHERTHLFDAESGKSLRP